MRISGNKHGCLFRATCISVSFFCESRLGCRASITCLSSGKRWIRFFDELFSMFDVIFDNRHRDLVRLYVKYVRKLLFGLMERSLNVLQL